MFDCLLPCLPKRRHQALKRRDQALEAEKTRYAIWSLEAAEEAVPARALGDARRLLEAGCAESAATALLAIKGVAKSCDTRALGAVWAAERAVRDVVVLRCLPQAEPWDNC